MISHRRVPEYGNTDLIISVKVARIIHVIAVVIVIMVSMTASFQSVD